MKHWFTSLIICFLIFGFIGQTSAKNPSHKKNGYSNIESLFEPATNTWHLDNNYQNSANKIEALQTAWEITQAPTDEKFVNYLVHSIFKNGVKEMALRPQGPKSCDTSANALAL